MRFKIASAAIALLAFASFGISDRASAQSSPAAGATVVASCDTSTIYGTRIGTNAPITEDQWGELCVNNENGGGGGTNVSIVSQTAGLALDTSLGTINSTLNNIQKANAGTYGNYVFVIDPGTGLPITYSLPTNVNLSQVNGTTILAGAGAAAAGSPRFTAAQDTTTIAGSAPGTAGTPSANVLTVQGATSMTPVQISPVAAATGGPSIFTLQAANSTNSGSIKGSAGTLYHVSVYNNSATLAWLILFNSASATPTCTGTPAYQIMIPANSTSGAGAVEDFAVGAAFSSGIGYCVTTGIGGTGSVNASTYVINATYK